MPVTDHPRTTTNQPTDFWSNLRHGGLMLDTPRLSALLTNHQPPAPINQFDQDRLRRRINQFIDAPNANRGQFVSFVLEAICGFKNPQGTWSRGADVSKVWSRKTITGEAIRPNHLWKGAHESLLPVFIEKEKRVGVGRGKKLVSSALQWLRQTGSRLAIITNGQEWRILYAGLDYEAFVQWDLGQWFTEGEPSDELRGFRSIVCPQFWAPETEDAQPPLLAAINDSRKGQAELSQVLGERVRQAVELLIQGNAPAINQALSNNQSPATNNQLPSTNNHPLFTSTDLYRAGVRFVMRMVVVLFAESRERLLPRDNPVYHDSYSLGGLRDQLQRQSGHRLRSNFGAYPRLISLFRVIYDGSAHPDMLIHGYGGQLFRPGDLESSDGMIRALQVLEQGCYNQDVMNDAAVHEILDLLSRTKVKIRQGRGGTWVPSPVDFSSLDSEYIGILYEGLLDFELRQATNENPIIFLAVGNQPALPLSILEAMDDKALKNLLDKMKDTSSGDDDADPEELEDLEADGEPEDAEESDSDEDQLPATNNQSPPPDDVRQTTRARAEAWANRAIAAGKLVKKPRGTMTEEKKLQHQAAIDRKARQIITKVILPGEWYLVRWGGTRKGSGTFYTRPQLAIPTVHRTLRPLAYDPPTGDDGQPNLDAPVEAWTPKRPEEILDLKVCDPACGSGSFPLAALRFLTDALLASLHYHDRIEYFSDRTVIDLIRDANTDQTLAGEALPCRPEDIDFEPRTKAVLRRYVVERCIYGVDFDPLAVELCRLSLWLETLNPHLPFTFLDHKIKCGNALIGTWFDQFMHYPPMAWMREGGDKNHSNGVHFEKGAWTKAISDSVSEIKDQLKLHIDEQLYLFTEEDLDSVATIHDQAEKALSEIHGLGIHEVERRASQYRALRESQPFIDAKFSLDLWCSIWFWPPEHLGHCPRVNEFYEGKLSTAAIQIVHELAAKIRFFHWQLEFPDVFSSSADGFDAAIGNPPWDIAKPNSKEFFSALDPLYRSYGKQEAIRKQTESFEQDAETERRWLSYNANFRAQSNWLKYSGSPYGKQVLTDSKGKQKHQYNLGDGGKNSFATSTHRHEKWEDNRESQTGFSRGLEDERGYHHQGGGDINLYKMFLEQAHAILRESGQLGMIVPSGIYSDFGTGDLRTLFLDKCRWRWLFGFENREKVFDIDSRFKFNPIIIQKGGKTDTIRTAFMRRNLNDWEAGEQFVTEYPRDRVLQFSPRSKAVLEIQSARDLEVLEKIYSNSVLLGDDGPNSWGIKYATEFHMTNDSKLFPPRDKWEERGYLPDEYSRWLKGNWQPRTTDCPAPPNCKRADIPEGVVLSRDAESWISEDEIDTDEFKDKKGKKHLGPAVALPVFEGRMISHFDFTNKGWVSGKGRTAVWREIPWEKKLIEPQFLMASKIYENDLIRGFYDDLKKQIGEKKANNWLVSIENESTLSRWRASLPNRIAFMDVTSATNERTMTATPGLDLPYGNSAPIFRTKKRNTLVASVLTSLTYDFVARFRCGGLHLNWFVVDESSLPNITDKVETALIRAAQPLLGTCPQLLSETIRFNKTLTTLAALTNHERIRLKAILNAALAIVFELDEDEFRWVLRDCDYPTAQLRSNEFTRELSPKGFWRIDKTIAPEHRLPVLSLAAYCDAHRAGLSGDAGVIEFLSQNNGEGWQLPERLRLSDYGLGHDDRAREYQPVRECFGPRFYDWQLEQTPEESWRECHLHARNLLGPTGYQALLDELAGKVVDGDRSVAASEQEITNTNSTPKTSGQGELF